MTNVAQWALAVAALSALVAMAWVLIRDTRRHRATMRAVDEVLRRRR